MELTPDSNETLLREVRVDALVCGNRRQKRAGHMRIDIRNRW